MKRVLLSYLLVACASALACSGAANEPNSVKRAGDRANSEKANADDKRTKDLRNRIEQSASNAKGRVGVAATVLETGESIALNPEDHFPMQSVYKFPIGMAALRQVDMGKITLAQRVPVEKTDFVRQGQHSPLRDQNPNGTEASVGELLRLMVSESDGTACDVLLRVIGGAKTVDDYLNELEVKEIMVVNTEKEIGQDWETQYRNWATPQAMVALLRALHERRGLSAQSRELLLKLMIETPTGAQRLKGMLPEGTVVAHKTGTSGNLKGVTAATNDVGLVTLPDGRHLAIAVFVADSPADSATREKVIAEIARAIFDDFATGR